MLRHAPILLLISALFLLYCQQREHLNIFDPQNPSDSIDLALRIVQSDSIVRLIWAAPSAERYRAFKIYRKKADETHFSFVGETPAEQTSFRDSSVQTDRQYWYYVRVVGQDVESPPSKTVHTVPGIGTFWLLDYRDFYIYRLTYDLQHIITTKYAIWRPREMAFNSDFSAALITYPEYHYFELFQPADGRSIRGFDALKYPFACIYNRQMQQFWISDSSGGLYRLNIKSTQPEMFSDFPLRPTQIGRNKTNQYFVLDRKRRTILIYTAEGTFIRTLTGATQPALVNPFFMAASPATTDLFIIDEAGGQNILYRYNNRSDSLQTLFSDAYLRAVTFDSCGPSLWLTIDLPDSANILQLFLSDLRLTKHSGFTKISDISLSPYNGHLLVADAGKKELIHFRRDFTRIGVFKNALYPFRIYNQ